jgi:hypothetical protein
LHDNCDAADTASTIVVFAIGVAVWCIAGSWLVSQHKITQVIQRWGGWIVPAEQVQSAAIVSGARSRRASARTTDSGCRAAMPRRAPVAGSSRRSPLSASAALVHRD